MKHEWTDLEFADWTLLPSEAARPSYGSGSCSPSETQRVWVGEMLIDSPVAELAFTSFIL
jgi:hypothetical protein